MKLKVWQWVVLGFITYLVFLVKYMPASWVVNSQFVNLPKGVSIANVTGTVWQGKSEQVIANGIAVNQLSWDLSFWSLLLGELNVDVLGGKVRDAESVYLKGELSTYLYNQEALTVRNFSLLVPAQQILGQIKLPVPITAAGRFKADIARLEFDQTCQQLGGSGGWNNGVVNGLQGPIEFGSFTALLSCEQSNVIVKVQDNNSLSLDATVTVKPNGKYTVQGRFNVPQDMPEEVKQAAVFFGEADANGFRVINL